MIILVELPQGVVIEVRRGGHDALAKLSSDMARLGISGYIRIERRPKNMIPKVGQVLIHESQQSWQYTKQEKLYSAVLRRY